MAAAASSEVADVRWRRTRRLRRWLDGGGSSSASENRRRWLDGGAAVGAVVGGASASMFVRSGTCHRRSQRVRGAAEVSTTLAWESAEMPASHTRAIPEL